MISSVVFKCSSANIVFLHHLKKHLSHCGLLHRQVHEGAPEVVVCGSYRTGLPESGDVDLIIVPSLTSPTAAEPREQQHLPDTFLSELIYSMQKSGFLMDHLALPHKYKDVCEAQRSSDMYKYLVTDRPQPIEHNHDVASLDHSTKDSTEGVDDNTADRNALGDVNAVGKKLFAPLIAVEDSDGYGDSIAEQTRQHHLMTNTATYLDNNSTGSEGNKSHNTEYNQTVTSESSTSGSHTAGSGTAGRGTYMGVCKLSKPDSLHRRIDIKVRLVLCTPY